MKKKRLSFFTVGIVLLIFSVAIFIVSAMNDKDLALHSDLTDEKVLRIADSSTVDDYKSVVSNPTVGGRYNGRVWSDKSVFAHDGTNNPNVVTLDEKFDISYNEDFLHVFSALGSSQVVTEYPPVPRMSLVIKAADKMITNLME